MGARQSKRSVDISGATKKGELESGVEDGKLERLEEGDIAPKATQNGTAPHADKDAPPVIEEVGELVNGDATTTETEIAQEQKETAEAANKEENLANGTPENPEAKEKTTEEAAATPDKEKKKKEKPKKKWSFRSISFSRKDKSKPNVAKDETLNGNVTKEEPVAEVVEAEGAAVTEAIPVKDEEPKKEGDAPERVEEEEKKEKTETTTETEPQSTEPASPVPAPVEPVPVPAPVESAPTPVEPAPAPAPVPEPVAEPTPAPEPTVPAPVETPAPETVPEPIVEAAPAPRAVESTPEPVQEEEVQATPVPEVESVLQAVTEVKIEELPPPLPASPPPTEAPPPTPVATIPDVSLHVDSLADTQETEVVGGGESMAEPEDVEPVLEEEIIVNGISPEQFIEEFSEKVEIGTENFKTIVTESIISNQVSENSEDNSEQTASAAE